MSDQNNQGNHPQGPSQPNPSEENPQGQQQHHPQMYLPQNPQAYMQQPPQGFVPPNTQEPPPGYQQVAQGYPQPNPNPHEYPPPGYAQQLLQMHQLNLQRLQQQLNPQMNQQMDPQLVAQMNQQQQMLNEQMRRQMNQRMSVRRNRPRMGQQVPESPMTQFMNLNPYTFAPFYAQFPQPNAFQGGRPGMQWASPDTVSNYQQSMAHVKRAFEQYRMQLQKHGAHPKRLKEGSKASPATGKQRRRKVRPFSDVKSEPGTTQTWEPSEANPRGPPGNDGEDYSVNELGLDDLVIDENPNPSVQKPQNPPTQTTGYTPTINDDAISSVSDLHREPEVFRRHDHIYGFAPNMQGFVHLADIPVQNTRPHPHHDNSRLTLANVRQHQAQQPPEQAAKERTAAYVQDQLMDEPEQVPHMPQPYTDVDEYNIHMQELGLRPIPRPSQQLDEAAAYAAPSEEHAGRPSPESSE